MDTQTSMDASGPEQAVVLPTGSSGHVERDAFIKAMRRTASSVCVVATDGLAGRFGVTVNAMTSVSADPPTILVCINQGNLVLPAVVRNGCFSVNVLHEDQLGISEVFAGRRPGPSRDRFSCGAWVPLMTGAPCLLHAIASFDCRLASRVTCGSHSMLIGLVVGARAEDAPPLVYHDCAYQRLEGAPTRVRCRTSPT